MSTLNGVCLQGESLRYSPALPSNFNNISNDGILADVQFMIAPEASIGVSVLRNENLIEYGVMLNLTASGTGSLAIYTQDLLRLDAGASVQVSQSISASSLIPGSVMKLSVQAARDVLNENEILTGKLIAPSGSVVATLTLTISLQTYLEEIFAVYAPSAKSYMCVRYVELSTVTTPCATAFTRYQHECLSNSDCRINNGGCNANQTCTTSLTQLFPNRDVVTALPTVNLTRNLLGNYCPCKDSFVTTNTSGCGEGG